MSAKAARRFGDMPGTSVYHLGGRPAQSSKLCVFWLEGRCNRNPCRFAHGNPQPQSAYHGSLKRSILPSDDLGPSELLGSKSSLVSACKRSAAEEKPQSTYQKKAKHSDMSPRDCQSRKSSSPKSVLVSASGKGPLDKTPASTYQQNPKQFHPVPEKSHPNHCPKNNNEKSLVCTNEGNKSNSKRQEKVCQHWVQGNCSVGDSCRYLHSWSHGNSLSMLAKLNGHKKAITGISLPSGSNNLCSVSTDGTARFWDCHTGQCANMIDFGGEVGSLITEGLWVFVGLANTVKAYNIQSNSEFSLNGPVGLVYAMVTSDDDMLFAGAQDGVISAWKESSESNPFELVASLKGHNQAVTCLIFGAKRLYSGSMDHTIRVWDPETFRCVQKLEGHTDVVMSLICWDKYLFSCSLDKTIKVWHTGQQGSLEVGHTQKEEHGVIAFCGMHDAEHKPILFCSCNDNSVHIYELPSFADRGKIFSDKEVRTMQTGPGGLLFTGDGSGMLTVWKAA